MPTCERSKEVNDRMQGKQGKPQARKYSERIVVDELFDDKQARILRAKRKPSSKPSDFSLNAWGTETEEIIESWRVEAFVGFTKGRRLREGDVFFVSDGRKLSNKYAPIKREEASISHLLIAPDKAREMARMEIKKQFDMLALKQFSRDAKKTQRALARKIETKYKKISDAEEPLK